MPHGASASNVGLSRGHDTTSIPSSLSPCTSNTYSIYIYIYVHIYLNLHLIYDSSSEDWKPGAPSLGKSRRRQKCDFGERDNSAPAELGGETHNVSRNRARTRVLLQARKLHVYGSGTFGAFWESTGRIFSGRVYAQSASQAFRCRRHRHLGIPAQDMICIIYIYREREIYNICRYLLAGTRCSANLAIRTGCPEPERNCGDVWVALLV